MAIRAYAAQENQLNLKVRGKITASGALTGTLEMSGSGQADTRLRRVAERGSTDFDLACAIVDAAPIPHAGFVIDGIPYVTPMAIARDGGDLLLHGSVASRLMKHLARLTNLRIRQVPQRDANFLVVVMTEKEQEEATDTAIVVDDEREPPVRLFTVDLNGGDTRRLTSNSDWIDRLEVSPDGRHVAFYEQHPKTDRDVWVAGLDEAEAPVAAS